MYIVGVRLRRLVLGTPSRAGLLLTPYRARRSLHAGSLVGLRRTPGGRNGTGTTPETVTGTDSFRPL